MRGTAERISAALIALPFGAFVVLSVLLWVGWAVTGRNAVLALYAAAPLAAGGLALWVSAVRGEPRPRRWAPALVAASAVTALVWVVGVFGWVLLASNMP